MQILTRTLIASSVVLAASFALAQQPGDKREGAISVFGNSRAHGKKASLSENNRRVRQGWPLQPVRGRTFGCRRLLGRGWPVPLGKTLRLQRVIALGARRGSAAQILLATRRQQAEHRVIPAREAQDSAGAPSHERRRQWAAWHLE